MVSETAYGHTHLLYFPLQDLLASFTCCFKVQSRAEQNGAAACISLLLVIKFNICTFVWIHLYKSICGFATLLLLHLNWSFKEPEISILNIYSIMKKSMVQCKFFFRPLINSYTAIYKKDPSRLPKNHQRKSIIEQAIVSVIATVHCLLFYLLTSTSQGDSFHSHCLDALWDESSWRFCCFKLRKKQQCSAFCCCNT